MARTGALYQLDGIRGFEADIQRASADMRAKLSSAASSTAIAIKNKAQALAPKDKGDLAANISFEGKGLNWIVGIRDVTLPSRGGKNTAHLNPWVYGVWYEFGFVTRKIQAQPYMRPAAESEDGAHRQRVESALRSSLPVTA